MCYEHGFSSFQVRDFLQLEFRVFKLHSANKARVAKYDKSLVNRRGNVMF